VITVIVLYFKAHATLARALRSALAQAQVSRVLVVDDGSTAAETDTALQAAAALDPRVQVVRMRSNLGFEGSMEHTDAQKHALVDRFAHNLIASGQTARTRVFRSTTEQFLRTHPAEPVFDLIYIDADHHADAALRDAVLAWPMLKAGGLMIFDDYLWADMPLEVQRPKLGIDASVRAYADRLQCIAIG
jgi:hypothetical protein